MTPRLAAIAVALLALAAALPAIAGPGDAGDSYSDRSLSAAYHRCTGTRPSTAELGQCLETESDRQEATLNAAYRQAMARLSPPRRDALRASEHAWVRDRERRCEAAYREMEGGTGAGPARLVCMATRAVARTRWIRGFR